ncbi:MAG: iron-sulfur cluster assembly accessory protein [Leptolyngbyaceae cyanobacterium SM1_1_3]|nr:iron-sulfur cluster assembly accessory protein [Leptolyngbyaceae cyanobacterium SM1_1_3]NJN02008.1 iron-sulfur cluster assembly accessory protein [Leptolyngbyaceae cyanobacterium RM1_1_2]NJO08287.1 iron-sulfur cluster assembly accessory protein [Leptolyngbyaceae cyanobacterium SL_1_1]
MIHLNPAAAAEINRLHTKSHASEAGPKTESETFCRIGFESGGCSEWYYTLTFDQASESGEDIVYCSHGVQCVVNAQHLGYLEGLVIDYSEDLMGGGFRFQNPNAAAHCGCGNSFSISLAGSEG